MDDITEMVRNMDALDDTELEDLAGWIRDEHDSIDPMKAFSGLSTDRRYMDVCVELARRGGEDALRYEDFEDDVENEWYRSWLVWNMADVMLAQSEAFWQAGMKDLSRRWYRKACRAYEKSAALD